MGVNETGTITLKILAQDLASGNIGKFIGHMDAMAKKGGLMGSVMQGVGQSFGQMLNPVGLVTMGIGKVTDFMGDSISAASDQAEALSKVTVVFGDQAKQIQAWAKTAATSMGMSETAALSAAGTLGNLFDGLGIANDAGLEMSKTITQLAADLGSFNNVATDEVMVALQSGLLGEAEPMRRFGSALSAARVEAYGFANGLFETVRAGDKTKRSMTEAHKVQARYALMLQDTKNAQGDFARTADGLANTQKSLDGAMAGLSASIGAFLIGPANGFLQWLKEVIAGATAGGLKIDEFIASQREQTKAQQEANGKLEEGIDIWGSYMDGLQAFNDVMTPYKDEAMDFSRSLEALGKSANVSQGDIEELFFFFKDEKGLGVERAKTATEAYLKSLVLAGETTSVTTPLLSKGWTESMSAIEEATEEAGQTIDTVMADMRSTVKRTLNSMNGTLADAMDPWKQAWKDAARYALDPFSPEKFEDRMERFSRRAARKAAEAAENGQGKVARNWTRLSNAALDPVVQAMTLIGLSVDEALAAIASVKSAGAQLRNFLDFGSIFDPAGNGNNTGGVEAPPPKRKGRRRRRAMGGFAEAGQTYDVGEESQERLTMLPGGGAIVTPVAGGGRSGTTVIINFNSVTPPSEAEGQRLARTLVPHIRREMGRAGI